MTRATSDRVTVVIPAYNRADTLPRAIRSALNQTYSNLTVIVVDDGSTDNTQAVLARMFPNEPRLDLIRLSSRGGAPRARNLGVEHAKCQYVAFLDSDDEWHTDKIECQVKAITLNDGAVAAFSWIEHRNQKGVFHVEKIPPKVPIGDLFLTNILGTTSSCLVSVDAFSRVGGFDPNLPSCQDWDLWLKLAARGEMVACQEPLTIYYHDSAGRISRNINAVVAGHKVVMRRISAYWPQ